MNCANLACGHPQEDHHNPMGDMSLECLATHDTEDGRRVVCACPGFEWPREPLMRQLDAVIESRTRKP